MSLSHQKKYLIAGPECFSDAEVSIKRKFDVIIEVNRHEDMVKAFEYIWKTEQDVIKSDPNKIKVAGISDFNCIKAATIRGLYHISGIQNEGYDIWNNKTTTYKLASKVVNVPKQYTLTPEEMRSKSFA